MKTNKLQTNKTSKKLRFKALIENAIRIKLQAGLWGQIRNDANSKVVSFPNNERTCIGAYS